MNNNNKAALYCRLSKDDEQSGDSVSIETQRMMLTKFCNQQRFEIFDIYVDDGYSGLNFNRPSFQRLINDLERNKFNILITKDLSRLGRDYIQTGFYIDVYFVTKGIRYIAINDGIDTLTDNNDIAPFKNILNDMYAKDLSRKVKSAKQQRAQNGLFISAQAPYGYKVDPYNRNRLVVDPEASLTVKKIFNLAKKGYSYSEISRFLEKDKIITPSVYKAIHGDSRFLRYATKENIYSWPYQTIKSIISNATYVGDMVNHKVEILNYKTKKRVRIPTEEQIVVQNTHEPIIDRKLFNLVNSKRSNKRKANHKFENIFKGLVFCAECGEEMQLIFKKLKYERKPMLRCAKHIADKQFCTHHHFIYYDDLLDEIKKQLDLQLSQLINSDMCEHLYESALASILERAKVERINQLQRKLQSINKRIKDIYKTLDRNKNSNELTDLYEMQKRLSQKITSTSSCFDIKRIDKEKINEMIKNHLLSYEVNEKTLHLFINKIEIGHLEKSDTGSYQKVKIYYKF